MILRGGGMYDAASLATMKFIVARNTVMYVLCTQLHTPRGVGMTKWGMKKAACGQALTLRTLFLTTHITTTTTN